MNTHSPQFGNDGSAEPERPPQPQQQPSATEQPGLLYDFSSFNPIQAHALQLTASAGLTNLMTNQPTPSQAVPQNAALSDGDTNQKIHQQPQIHHYQTTKSQRGQQQINQPAPQPQIHQLPQKPQQMQQQQNPYFYIHPSNSAPTSLHPVAPVVVSQAPIVGQASGNFILPATAQGATLAAAMPANFQAPIFPNTLATPNSAPGIIPSLLMTHQFQPQLVHPVASKKRGKQDTAVNKQQPRKKKRELEPSVVSSTTSTESSGQCGSKEAHPDQECASMEPQVDLSRMTASERRRYERNLREQQRSYKISQQVKELREVLAESNVPFKPNKYSILLSVVEYIKQLQARAIMLDAEHQKLITTIRQTNELVNSGNAPSSADETYATNLTGNTSSSDPGSDSEMIFVQGINYKSVFEQCPAALGIAALDGRILECNFEFQLLLGFARDELMKQSLFNLVQNHQDIFRAMAEMLKSAEDEPLAFDRDTPSSSALKNCVWSGPVISKRDAKLLMNLTLTLGSDGSPKFFSCSVTSL